MSVVLDEQTDLLVLEGLDFEVPCARGEHPAEVMVRCRSCGTGSMLCRDHLAKTRKHVEDFIASHLLAVCVCAECKAIGASFDDLVEVISL